MNCHILVITSTYLSRYMKDVLGTPVDNISFRFVEYQKFTDLEKIYLENEKWADGVLTTGIVVQTVLERTVQIPLKPILSLATDNESFYRIPLNLLIENRSFDPERIVFDVFVNVVPQASVLRLLESKSMTNMFPEFFGWLSKASLEELERVEEDTLHRIEELWKAEKIDMVICRYSSLVPRLKEMNIPCVFASGTDEHVQGVLKHLLAKIKIEKITSHAPAVIMVCPEETKDHVWTERMEIALQKALMDFAYKNDTNFLLQKRRERVFALTEKAVVSYITEDFKKNHLLSYLKEYIDFNIRISYGIGNSIEDAMDNAQKAFQEAGISGDSFLVDEENRVIGPLESEDGIIENDTDAERMKEIAKKSSLSVATIERIFRLMILLGRREVTSAELADSFHISLRGANRILQKLEENGFATITFQKSGKMRGRPTKIYKINLE